MTPDEMMARIKEHLANIDYSVPVTDHHEWCNGELLDGKSCGCGFSVAPSPTDDAMFARCYPEVELPKHGCTLYAGEVCPVHKLQHKAIPAVSRRLGTPHELMDLGDSVYLDLVDGTLWQLAPEPLVIGSSETRHLVTHDEKYGAAALQGERDNVLKAEMGTRNSTLIRSAYKIGQLIPKYLNEDDAINDLLDAALTNGLPLGEASGTIRRGLNDGMKNPRP